VGALTPTPDRVGGAGRPDLQQRLITGEAAGSLWGTDIYTGDSALAVAAVHAGLVNVGGTVVVKVIVEQPRTKYQGSVRNGVTSQENGQCGTAYRPAAV
jgi:hypothetical protein